MLPPQPPMRPVSQRLAAQTREQWLPRALYFRVASRFCSSSRMTLPVLPMTGDGMGRGWQRGTWRPKVTQRPRDQGTSETPSGRFPSDLLSPLPVPCRTGPARLCIARHTTRRWAGRGRGDAPCATLAGRPMRATGISQGHCVCARVWRSHRLAPRRRPTATRLTSSSIGKPDRWYRQRLKPGPRRAQWDWRGVELSPVVLPLSSAAVSTVAGNTDHPSCADGLQPSLLEQGLQAPRRTAKQQGCSEWTGRRCGAGTMAAVSGPGSQC